MWLLNVETKKLKSFEDANRPHYAILSHRWEDDEVTFKDVMKNRCANMKGWRKIEACCEKAREDGLQYIWADTCCIDKRSSAELSEAINSMYRWYREASVCYAFLADVGSSESADEHDTTTRFKNEESGKNHKNKAEANLVDSVWFTRGWTLQELLAPMQLEFFDQSWKFLGTKIDHAQAIEKVTSIPTRALRDFMPNRYCIAQRMSWAARRKTSRIEDQAYSLLGIFDVSLPLLYGEGSKAFFRLQEELIRTSTDCSIFAWGSGQSPYMGMLAASPASFDVVTELELQSWSWEISEFYLSKYGLQIQAKYFRTVGRYIYVRLGVGGLEEIALVLHYEGTNGSQELFQRILVDGYACVLSQPLSSRKFPATCFNISWESQNSHHGPLTRYLLLGKSSQAGDFYVIPGLLSPCKLEDQKMPNVQRLDFTQTSFERELNKSILLPIGEEVCSVVCVVLVRFFKGSWLISLLHFSLRSGVPEVVIGPEKRPAFFGTFPEAFLGNIYDNSSPHPLPSCSLLCDPKEVLLPKTADVRCHNVEKNTKAFDTLYRQSMAGNTNLLTDHVGNRVLVTWAWQGSSWCIQLAFRDDVEGISLFPPQWLYF